jgi:uncharacterized protein DUF5330
MVSKWWMHGCSHFCRIEHHQSKIYAESNLCDFLQVFAEFTSMKTLTLYPRLLVRNQSCGLTAAQPKDDRGRDMSFLLRMAFWLGLVLVLLPREKTPESDKAPQIGATEAASAAGAAISDMSQFCKRQPAACEVGGQAATAIGQRAQDGARQLYKIITDKKPEQPAVQPSIQPSAPGKRSDHTGSIDAEAVATAATPADALTDDDMAIEWRLPRTPLASK